MRNIEEYKGLRHKIGGAHHLCISMDAAIKLTQTWTPSNETRLRDGYGTAGRRVVGGTDAYKLHLYTSERTCRRHQHLAATNGWAYAKLDNEDVPHSPAPPRASQPTQVVGQQPTAWRRSCH